MPIVTRLATESFRRPLPAKRVSVIPQLELDFVEVVRDFGIDRTGSKDKRNKQSAEIEAARRDLQIWVPVISHQSCFLSSIVRSSKFLILNEERLRREEIFGGIAPILSPST
jgi:hypothetical protein